MCKIRESHADLFIFILLPLPNELINILLTLKRHEQPSTSTAQMEEGGLGETKGLTQQRQGKSVSSFLLGGRQLLSLWVAHRPFLFFLLFHSFFSRPEKKSHSERGKSRPSPTKSAVTLSRQQLFTAAVLALLWLNWFSHCLPDSAGHYSWKCLLK